MRVVLPGEPPIAVFPQLAAHLGDVSIGGPDFADLSHLADPVVYPTGVAVVFKKWLFRPHERAPVVVQAAGPLRVRVGRFPPWQNTVVWVRQDQRLVMLRMSGRSRSALRKVLTATGFGIKEDRASLAAGSIYYES